LPLQSAVDALAGSAVGGVYGVVNGLAVFELDFAQVALIVVAVAGRSRRAGSLAQVACGVVLVGVGLPGLQLIFAARLAAIKPIPN
jgi:predicted branched-subunit amino acid permease